MAGKENSVMLQEILNNEEFFRGKFSDFHHIKHLINDFRWILEQKETEPFQGNEEYMGLMELYYLLKKYVASLRVSYCIFMFLLVSESFPISICFRYSSYIRINYKIYCFVDVLQS
jgi:hypothetical protein